MIIQILPVTTPLWAVFTDIDGNPDVRPVVCVGILDFGAKRVVGAFPVGEHLEPADLKPDFVSLASSADPEPWREKCQAKRAAIVAEEANKAATKLWTPEKAPVGAFVPQLA